MPKELSALLVSSNIFCFCHPLTAVLTADVQAAGKLLSKQPELKANFSRAQGAFSAAKANKVARFLPNPEANWGPKPKHGRPIKVCMVISRNQCFSWYYIIACKVGYV